MELRELASVEVDGAVVGLAGAQRVFRIRERVDYIRRGKVYKTTDELRFGVTSLTQEEASEAELLQLIRGYWGIETRQHHRRDATQGEDRCSVRNPTAARNLSLMRSLAIFLYERKRPKRRECRSLSMWQRRNLRDPQRIIPQLIE